MFFLSEKEIEERKAEILKMAFLVVIK